jgi:hypothetical protein
LEERALLGTWVVDEFRLAVQKGYRLLEVLEMYEYKVTQYDRQTGMKAEVSGYPS